MESILSACRPWQVWDAMLERMEAPVVFIDGGYAFLTVLHEQLIIIQWSAIEGNYCALQGLPL